MHELDSKDKKILEILQKDGRTTLRDIGKSVGLSIDSVNKRIKKLKENGIISKIGAFIDPKALGYELVSTVHIKLQNISELQHKEFVDFLTNSKYTIEVISVLGSYDITCVFIAKTTDELEKIYRNVRHTFKSIIADWESAINLKVHKFEEYVL